MDRLTRDVRIALRGFRRTPAFAIATILILGIGIGMAAATASVYDAVLVRALPVIEQDRVVLPRLIDRVGVAVDLMPPQIAALDRDAHTMRGVAGVMHGGVSEEPMSDAGRNVTLGLVTVSGNLFHVLGTQPHLGRLIGPGDDVAKAPFALVLSYRAWQRAFAADPQIVGRKLRWAAYTAPVTIIGVAPPGLDYPLGVDGWLADGSMPGGRMMNVIARLAPGATPSSAAAELLAFMQHSDVQAAALVESARAHAETVTDAIVGNVRPALRALTAAVALLLLIVCVNIANLVLSRAASRSRELAIRHALGASSGDIVRQLLVESALLALAGGMLGLALAEVALHLVVTAAPADLPRLDAVRLGFAPLMWCAATTVFTLLAFGVGPALLATRNSLTTHLRSDTRSGQDSRGKRRMRHALVAAQVALAVVVLTSAGLLARTFGQLKGLHLGFEPARLSFVELTIPWEQFDYSVDRVRALYDAVERELHTVRGVVAVSPSLAAPFTKADVFLLKVVTETGVAAARNEQPLLPITIGGSELFQTLGLTLARGRAFLPGEGSEKSPRIAVISEAAARLLWPGENAIGKRFRATWDTTANAWTTVVGVSADVRYRRLREIQPMLFIPWRQYYWQGTVAVRADRPIAFLEHDIERAVRAANPLLSVSYVHPAANYLDTLLEQPRMSAALLSALGLAAALLASIGLYAIMASAVTAQTREIGVRMALGATPERVRAEVLRTALRVTAVGAVAGLVAAISGGRLMSRLLFEVSPTDPLTLAGAALVLLFVSAAAAYLPARRATRVDPVTALRAD